MRFVLIKKDIPKEIIWDYENPPDDLFWRLQRIANFFPMVGIDKRTVKLLFEYRKKLKLEEGKFKLIKLYHEAWNKKTN